MIRPANDTKILCERLADSWRFEEASHSVRLIEALVRNQFPSVRPKLQWQEPDEIQRIGIWHRDKEGQEASFVRRTEDDPGHHWAETEKITRKHQKKRVVLLGESVAKGFYYDPHFTPALALQHILGAVSQEEIEVVDLSRVALDFWGLLDLMVSCRALEPDAVVIMAGNNWHPLYSGQIWTHEDSREAAAILRRGGNGVLIRDRFLNLLGWMTTTFLSHAEILTRQYMVPVVYMLPEFNLADWRIPEVTTPLLLAEETRQWFAEREKADAALSRGDLREAEVAAKKLLELDGGTHPSGFYFLADLYGRSADEEILRPLLEQARDSLPIMPTNTRCAGQTASIIRREADRHGVTLVDLPRCISEYLSGSLPDRRIFHDTCHLTYEGIQLAMVRIAECLLPLLGEKPRSWKKLMQKRLPISSRVVAEANLLAALCNSVHSQNYDLIRFHLEKALENSDDAVPVLLALLDSKVQRTPFVFSIPVFEAFARLQGVTTRDYLESTSAARLLQGAPLRYIDRLELPYIQAATDVLAQKYPRLAEDTLEKLCHQHAITEEGYDLLQCAYNESPITSERRWDRATERRWLNGGMGFFQAFGIKSSFMLVWDGQTPVELTITYRCRNNNSQDQHIQLMINGKQASVLPLTREWQTARCPVSLSLLNKGANRVTIRWQTPDESQIDSHRHSQIDALELGGAIELELIHGELYELWVRALCPGSKNRQETELCESAAR